MLSSFYTGTYLLMSFCIYPSTSDDRSTEEMRPEMFFVIHNGHGTEIKRYCKAGRNGSTMGVTTNTVTRSGTGSGGVCL